mgnify:CR=1
MDSSGAGQRRRGLAQGEAIGGLDGLGGGTTAGFDLLDDGFDGQSGDGFPAGVNGGKRRHHVGRFLHVIEADNANIIRHGNAAFAQFTQHAPRQQVIQSEHGIELQATLQHGVHRGQTVGAPPALGFDKQTVITGDAARGIPCDDSLLIETQGWGSADGLAAVDTMLESGLQFDAVFALNDLLAWGVLRELRERGVAVPDDVRVIGFDDVEESAYMVPSLSTVNPGREAIARLAVESIIQQVESGSRAPAQTIEAPYSLSLRESSPALACA